MKQLIFLSFHFRMFRGPEVLFPDRQEHESQDEQQDDAQDSEAGFPGQPVEQLIQGRPDHAGKLAENIHEAEIFAAALRRNQLTEIAAAEGLDAALHGADQRRQNPEQHLADGIAFSGIRPRRSLKSTI